MVASGMVPVAFDAQLARGSALNTDTASSGTPAARILSVGSAQALGGHAATLRCGHGPRSREVRTPHRAAGPPARGSPPLATSPPTATGSADHVLRLARRARPRGRVPSSPPTSRCPASRRRRPLNAALAAHGIRVLVPITLPDFDLDWHDAADATESPLGPDAVALADVVLAPGLAVDQHGTRMGQGGGCYDRALPRRRPGTPVVVVLHPGELLDPAEPPLPRRAARPAGRRRGDAPTGVTDLGLSPWRRTPPGRRVSTSGSVSRTAASAERPRSLTTRRPSRRSGRRSARRRGGRSPRSG